MKKRLLYILLALLLAVPHLGLTASPPVHPEAVTSNVGRSYSFTQSRRGSFESNNAEVAWVDSRGNVSFLSEGDATVTFTEQKSEKKASIAFTVFSGGSIPPEVEKGIAIALSEWEDYLQAGRSIPKSNKYTKWRCGRPCEFGWCGAFVNYSLDMGGVPMMSRDDAVLITDGRAAAIREAAVPKILEGFKKMDRISFIPQPGSEVIYGRRGGYTTIHVGFVTAVKDLGDGKYEVQTVEGNMGPRIRRYHYIYDSLAENYERNMIMLPKEQQIEPDTFHYPLHLDGAWYVTAFGQTWY